MRGIAYLIFKLLHGLGIVLLVGNVTVTAVSKGACRSRARTAHGRVRATPRHRY